MVTTPSRPPSPSRPSVEQANEIPVCRVRDADFVRVVDGVGPVRQRREVLAVSLPFVSFRYTYTFLDGTDAESVSTLRYRGDAECRRLLSAAGMHVVDVRDAPDRPGLERVYLARPR